jgi:hypothetical protein
MAKPLDKLRAFAGQFHVPRMGPELKRKLALGIPIEPTSPDRMKEIIAELKAKRKAP